LPRLSCCGASSLVLAALLSDVRDSWDLRLLPSRILGDGRFEQVARPASRLRPDLRLIRGLDYTDRRAFQEGPEVLDDQREVDAV
jgi:hypothetical protein